MIIIYLNFLFYGYSYRELNNIFCIPPADISYNFNQFSSNQNFLVDYYINIPSEIILRDSFIFNFRDNNQINLNNSALIGDGSHFRIFNSEKLGDNKKFFYSIKHDSKPAISYLIIKTLGNLVVYNSLGNIKKKLN
jgi:hypothetical protein